MQKSKPQKRQRKPQSQPKPGLESKMTPVPVYDYPDKKGCGKLTGKTAFITGGDSGIGRAVSVLFAKEGCNVVIVYLREHKDAEETREVIEEKYGSRCLLISGDLRREKFCSEAVSKAIEVFGQIDILVNNAAVHYEAESLEDISSKQLIETFETNFFSLCWITRYALPHIRRGGSIINTSSVTAYRGSGHLLDYSATKGAIISFTRSLSASLADKGIRVNAVAPGPVWTPLIVSSFDPSHVATFGSDVPMKRAGEPAEIAPCYLFLACEDSSYMSGQVLHPNGGEIVNG